MRRCRENLPNRCCHLTSRVNRRAFEGVQAANRRKLGSVPSRWLGGSVVRWLGSCANPQPETHTSRPENEGLVPKLPILKCHIIRKEQANIMQIACAVAGSVPKFFSSHHSRLRRVVGKLCYNVFHPVGRLSRGIVDTGCLDGE